MQCEYIHVYTHIYVYVDCMYIYVYIYRCIKFLFHLFIYPKLLETKVCSESFSLGLEEGFSVLALLLFWFVAR